MANPSMPDDFILDRPPASTTPESPVSTFDRWRGPLATLLLVLFMVSAGLAVPAVWARNQMLDTDRFVRTVSPLGDNAGFQDSIANRVTSIITAEVSSTDIVSENDGIAATLLPAVTHAAVNSITHSFVSSPEFPAVWDESARLAHTGFVALLEGGDSPLFDTQNGQVSVDLTPVVQAVFDDISARGISIPAPTSDLTFVVFESSQLADLQNISSELDNLSIILTIVALASLFGYVLIAPNRWWGAIVAAGLGLAISMLAVLLFVVLMRWLYMNNLSDTVDKDAARYFFDTLTNYLRAGLRIIGLIGLAVAGATYLLALRGRVSFESDDEARRSLYERNPVLGRIENAVAVNRMAAAGIWAAFICAVIFLLDWTDFGWVIVLLVAGAAGLILIFRAKTVPADFLAAASAAPASPRPGTGQSVSQSLQQLADLKTQGLLTDEDFDRAKSLVLTSN